MDVVFCGTPQFAVPTLEKLVASGFNVRLVVTQPDRPGGRGMEVIAPPVKRRALEFGLPVIQPEKIKNNTEFQAQLEQIKPEAIVVVGYGRIIPQWMINLPPMGNINVHASLLPKYRGAAPIQWAIARGETVTGVTIMRIDAGLDTGDILLQDEAPIRQEDTSETLAPRLSELGAELLVQALPKLKSGEITPRPQEHSQATLAPILTKENGRIDFRRNATEIFNRLRGFQPWPGAYAIFRGKNLNLSAARPAPSLGELAPGELKTQGEHLYVGCSQNTTLEMLELQPEGKKRMSARDFIHGYRPKPGEMLDGVHNF
jgi:methionyl-tRNA formyltransferase